MIHTGVFQDGSERIQSRALSIQQDCALCLHQELHFKLCLSFLYVRQIRSFATSWVYMPARQELGAVFAPTLLFVGTILKIFSHNRKDTVWQMQPLIGHNSHVITTLYLFTPCDCEFSSMTGWNVADKNNKHTQEKVCFCFSCCFFVLGEKIQSHTHKKDS